MNFLAWLPNRLAIEMELNVGTIEPFLILQDTTYIALPDNAKSLPLRISWTLSPQNCPFAMKQTIEITLVRRILIY